MMIGKFDVRVGESPAAAQTIRCRICGTLLDPDWLNCPKCEGPSHTSRAAAPAAPLPQPAEYKPEGDLFWDDEDPEQSQHDPRDVIAENYRNGEIVTLQQAQSLPKFYGFTWPKNDDTDDDEEHYFVTKEAAEKALESLKLESAPLRPESK